MSEGGLHGVLFKRERDVRRERRLPILSGGEESELLLLLALLSFADGQSLSGSVQERGRKKTTSLSTAEEEESEKNCVLFGSVADGRRSLLSALLIVPSEKESDSPSFFLSPLRFISLSSLRGAIATRIHLRISLSLSGSSCPRKKQKRRFKTSKRKLGVFSFRNASSNSLSDLDLLFLFFFSSGPGRRRQARPRLRGAGPAPVPGLDCRSRREARRCERFVFGGGGSAFQTTLCLSLPLSLLSLLTSFLFREKKKKQLSSPRSSAAPHWTTRDALCSPAGPP